MKSCHHRFGTLVQGASLVLERRAQIISHLDAAIEQNACTHVCATPALWRLLFSGPGAGAPEAAAHRLPSLRVLLLGGERWRWCGPSSSESPFVPGNLRELYNIYGVTECTIYQAASASLQKLEGKEGC